MRDCLVGLIQLLVALGDAEIGNCIFLFPNQSILIAGECGSVVLPLHVKFAHLIILHGPVRVPGMHLQHVGYGLSLGVGSNHSAVGMILGVIFGRAQVNPGVVAGTL